MANEKNLIPQAHELTVEEQSRGGKASGKARREKANLRKMAQAILDGTFTDENGTPFSGVDLVQNGLMANLGNPNGRNWGKAMDIIMTLNGAAVSAEQMENIKAATEKIKAETRRITGDTEHHNGMLEELIKGLKQDDVHAETENPDAALADESTETNQPT